MHAHLRAPLRSRYYLHCTATTLDSPDNRFTNAKAIRGNRIHVKSVAMVAYEYFHQFAACLAVDGNRLSSMRYRIDKRLLRGIKQRIGLRAWTCVAHRHHFDRLAMRVFHMCGDLFQTGVHGTVRRGAFLIQPFTQFAFLRARQRKHRLLIVGMQLNQRQRLQYAIMQMRGHVGTFLFAFLRCAFRTQIANQRHDPWHNRKQYANQQCQTGAQYANHGKRVKMHAGTDVQSVCGENNRNAAKHRP